MSKVVITGSKGTIGHVLHRELGKNHQITGLDLPESNILDYDFLLQQFKDADVIIHTAHAAEEKTRENWRSGRIDPTNVALEMNVFTAAVEAGVKRVIVASSVHADNFNAYEGTELLTIPGSYSPASPYGTHKLILEEMGRFHAKHSGLEFVAVRFGGVTRDNSVRTHLKEPAVWLSHQDLTNAIEACIAASGVPDNFAVFYAVSNNDGRIHSTDNPFKWEPLDNSKDHL